MLFLSDINYTLSIERITDYNECLALIDKRFNGYSDLDRAKEIYDIVSSSNKLIISLKPRRWLGAGVEVNISHKSLTNIKKQISSFYADDFYVFNSMYKGADRKYYIALRNIENDIVYATKITVALRNLLIDDILTEL